MTLPLSEDVDRLWIHASEWRVGGAEYQNAYRAVGHRFISWCTSQPDIWLLRMSSAKHGRRETRTLMNNSNSSELSV